jgi:uncharacterized protein YdcH (DUF465 family)
VEKMFKEFLNDFKDFKSQINSRFDNLEAEVNRINARIDNLESAVNARIDGLGREVSAINTSITFKK